MGNAGNLRPPFSPEEARENGRKGGLERGRREKLRKAEEAQWRRLLSMALYNGKKEAVHALEEMQIDRSTHRMKKNVRVDEAIKLKLISEALNGNLQAIRMIYDLSGLSEAMAEPDEACIEEEKTDAAIPFINALNEKAGEVWEDADGEKSEDCQSV